MVDGNDRRLMMNGCFTLSVLVHDLILSWLPPWSDPILLHLPLFLLILPPLIAPRRPFPSSASSTTPRWWCTTPREPCPRTSSCTPQSRRGGGRRGEGREREGEGQRNRRAGRAGTDRLLRGAELSAPVAHTAPRAVVVDRGEDLVDSSATAPDYMKRSYY